MANLRIIADNAADRATLAASSTAGSLVAANLQSNLKGLVWRSTGKTATLTATWASGETVGCVALPWTNLTQSATIRVRAYSDAGTTLLCDTGAVVAAPAAPIKMQGWGASASGVNAYAFGGGASARVWFTPVSGVKQLTIDLSDTSNPASYLEASRLVTGAYWSPIYNADLGQALNAQDTSEHYRTDAGDLLTNVGTRSRKTTLNLSYMPAADRTAFMSIIRGNGKATPVFLSLYPQSSDFELERDNEIFGKISEISDLSIQFYNAHSSQLVIEEV